MSTKKSEQVILPASKHSAYHQRMAGSPLAGLTNTQHLDAGVGIDVTKADTDAVGAFGVELPLIERDCMGRPLPNTSARKSEVMPSLGGMRI
ncbi:MAG: hypothetical protein GXP38_05005 [Chloroflexi bacterium]|nr:hypothetical protein [Chloroflexota bacterium]